MPINPHDIPEAVYRFFLAILEGDVDVVRAYIEVNRNDPMMMNFYADYIHEVNRSSVSLPPLMLAISRIGQMDENTRQDIIRALLAAPGTDVHATIGNLLTTPLMQAVNYNDEFTLRQLVIRPRINLTQTNAQNQTALLLAAELNRDNMCGILLNAIRRAAQSGHVVPAPPSSPPGPAIPRNAAPPVAPRSTRRHGNDFFHAIDTNDNNVIENLLRLYRNNVAYLNLIDSVTGDTALIIAARAGNSALVQELLQPGLNIETRNFAGFTAAEEAARAGHHDIARDITLLISDRQDQQFQNPAPPPAPATPPKESPPASPHALSFQERLDAINYEGKIPPYLLDQIMQSTIMNEPITLPNGQTYDRQSLLGWFAQKGNPDFIKCPLTNIRIYLKDAKEFLASITIKNMISDFVSEQEKAYKLAQSKAAKNPETGEKEQKEKMIKARLSYFSDNKKTEEEEEEVKPQIKKS